MAAGEPLGSREWSAEAVALGVGVGAAGEGGGGVGGGGGGGGGGGQQGWLLGKLREDLRGKLRPG